jgi:hypothetical protein
MIMRRTRVVRPSHTTTTNPLMAAATLSLPPHAQVAATLMPVAPSTRKTRPVARVSLASLTPNNLGTLRKLNSVLFPIRYSEKFYRQVLEPELEEFCKLSECRAGAFPYTPLIVDLLHLSLLQ